MKRLLVAAVVLAGTAALVAPVLAQTPTEPAWPPGVAQVFVSAHTLTAANAAYTPKVVGQQENFFPQTSDVVFQAYAVDLKTQKVITAKDATYFYVSIPNQPNVKLTYTKVGTSDKAPWLWIGKWTIPATYPLGLVPFKVLVKTTAKRYGIFVQAPIATSQLTVIAIAKP